jgi:uncharacterized repeat protein (TIGR03803 family)
MNKGFQAGLAVASTRPLVIGVSLLVLGCWVFNASAQTETTLYSFVVSDGAGSRAALVKGNDGNFYGTAQYGGTSTNCPTGCGTVFRIAPSGTETTLYSFAGFPDGYYPAAGLVQGSDGNFYGTTEGGGLGSGLGTVFRISPNGNYSNLHSFGNAPDGRLPVAGLVQGSDSNLYGTTEYGGTGGCNGGCGTIFRISPSGTYTTLYSFGYSPAGYFPQAGLVQGSDGNFYGTTLWGGTASTNCETGCGTIFRISPSGTYTTLYSFTGYPNDGGSPLAGLVQGSDGNFYGTTQLTIFKISPAGTYTNLHFFSGSPTDGWIANGLVQGSDSNFYGTTQQGGANPSYGTVFRISPSGSYSNLYSFASFPNDGTEPLAGLVQGNDGNFYGTTSAGGVELDGTVFRISPGGSYTSLYSFGKSPNGVNPFTGLVQGSDGSFYGTAAGGTNYYGTIFRIDPSGSLTNLYFFSASLTDGWLPNALVQGSDGNFYGTTGSGGTGGGGTVFRFSLSGTYTTLYSFGSVPDDGGGPNGLVQGSDGSFYGTTYDGGTNDVASGGDGTVFRISASGIEVVLYSFGSSPSDGEQPYAGLVQGSDGNFYGTTFDGGVAGKGTVFRISPSGIYTNLYSFAGYPNDGGGPEAGLVQGSDGSFYGTTVSGGAIGNGTVFRITPRGTETILYSFGSVPNDGHEPEAGLVQGSDGNFYGTTSDDVNGNGTLFRISPSGNYSNLYSFGNCPDGANPYAGLVQGTDGNFYGTTEYGGMYNGGTVFRLNVPLSPPPYPINQITGVHRVGTNIIFNIPSIAGETYQLQYRNSLTSGTWSNVLGVTVTNSIGALLTLTNSGGAVGPQGFYRFAITP